MVGRAEKTGNMDQQQPTSGRLQIGDLVLDTGKRQVRRGDAILDLPKLSYQLVLTLARAAPNLVTHDELVETVWSGKFVSPETVTQRIKLVRQALGDNANSPRYIGLVRGEGYRMLAEVRELPDQDDGFSQHLFAELGRRRVLQTALIYAAAAWSITEVLSFLIDALPVFPEGSKSFVAILFVVGFPVTMFLAWRFDIGPGGIRRAHASSVEGRLTIVAATVLLIGATAGLFYLVYPSVVGQEESRTAHDRREAPAANTIAVMPFENASQYIADDYIPKGLSDELRDQLGRIGGMRVAARSSSVIFQDQTLSAPEIATRLGVAQLIEGTVRRQDDILHITVTVIDGESGFGDWTRTFQKKDDDLLTAQQEIATEIVALLMPDSDPSLGRSTLATLDASANELLQLARATFQDVKDQPTVNIEQLMLAIDLYRQATEADPGSALAHSRYADALLYLGDVESAGAAIERALEIDPNLSEVQHTLGLYRWIRFEDGVGEAHARAIELDPFNADALAAYGQWLWHQPDVDASEEYFLRALEQDPESLVRYRELGNFYGVSGQRDKALEIAADIQERFSQSPQKAVAFLEVARIHELVGNLDVGIAWALRSRAADPDFPDALWMLAELYARIGDEEGTRYFDPDMSFANLFWLRRYDEMIEVGEELVLENPNQVQVWYGLARAHLALGNYEQAIYILDQQGLPEKVFVDSRRANGIETLMTYADALNVDGQAERAREYADFVSGIMHRLTLTGAPKAWWPNMYEACGQSIVGQDELALETLERVVESPGLLWYPVLVDSPCFRKFADEPRYQAVVQSVEERQEVLRDRLPDTLQRLRVMQ